VSLWRGRVCSVVLLSLSAASLLDACASPTQIRLRVHTNVPCTDQAQWKGVAIYAGTPGPSLEAKAPALTTTQCDEHGLVGTLVVIPSAEKDDEVGLRVVGGIAHDPEECAAHQYMGCIVARRQVRFTRHETLDLQVELTSQCVGFGCDATHTCVAGMCTETQTVPAATTDAGLPNVDAGKSVVRCGDNGVFCPTTGNVCCLSVDRDAGTTSGECKDPALCSPKNIVLACDDESDCADYADATNPGTCLVAYERANLNDQYTPSAVSLSHCISYAAFSGTQANGLDMCQTRESGCVNGRFPCLKSDGNPTNPLPGYFWCKITN
jgi:hypothetical protein